MGMFDSIYLNSECPNCGKIEEREFQTKDLECMLDTYKEGDCVKDKIEYEVSKNNKCLEAIGSCHSDECIFKGNVSDTLWQGAPSGFGFVWNCKIRLDDKYCISSEIYDIEIVTEFPDNWEDIIKYIFGDYWEFLLEKYKGNKKEAIDKIGYSKNRRRFITMIRKMDYSRLLWREAEILLYNEEYRKEVINRVMTQVATK